MLDRLVQGVKGEAGGTVRRRDGVKEKMIKSWEAEGNGGGVLEFGNTWQTGR